MQLRIKLAVLSLCFLVFGASKIDAQTDYYQGNNPAAQTNTGNMNPYPNTQPGGSSGGYNNVNNFGNYAPYGQQGLAPNNNWTNGAAPEVAPQMAPQRIRTKKLNPKEAALIYQWFVRYDNVRRQAQMSPVEKQKADIILTKGLAILFPGPEKLEARQILVNLVEKYNKAVKALQALNHIPETEQLQQAYLQYFMTARQLFSDYLQVQDNLMVQDATGQPLAAQLMQRKADLETLEHSCKDLDAQMRAAYHIPAFQNL